MSAKKADQEIELINDSCVDLQCPNNLSFWVLMACSSAYTWIISLNVLLPIALARKAHRLSRMELKEDEQSYDFVINEASTTMIPHTNTNDDQYTDISITLN